MVRLILWLVCAIVAVTFLRGVIGIFGKALGNYIGGSRAPERASGASGGGSGGSSSGMLRKCAECGTFAPVYATVQRGGERHYCSAECQEKAEAARQ
jgi:hypothetical protein